MPHGKLVARSRLFRTPAWGVAAQPDFVNAAAVVATRLPPEALLAELLRIERESGRDRGSEPKRWGPRALDLDLLTYGDAIVARPGLSVPHPHLHERAFVLVPLAEIAPDLEVPGRGSVAALRAAIDAQGIVPLVE